MPEKRKKSDKVGFILDRCQELSGEKAAEFLGKKFDQLNDYDDDTLDVIIKLLEENENNT
jgi:hypothetical protein